MAKDYLKIGIGCALIALALLPTPDDVTVVSPVAQAGLGLTAIYAGLD